MHDAPDRITSTRHPGPAGPELVLLHSLALDQSIWARHLPRLTELATVITLDLPGHGGSARTTALTIEEMADEVADSIRERTDGPVVLWGLSLGGSVAQALAARHPELVAALGLADTTAWYGENAPAEWEARARRVVDGGFEALAEFQIARWFTDAFPAREPETVRHLLRIFTANDVGSYVATCRAMGAMDLREAIRTIDVPTDVLVGQHDPATPPEHAHDLADRIPGARLRVLAGCSHLSPLEAPDEFVAEVRRSIRRIA